MVASEGTELKKWNLIEKRGAKRSRRSEGRRDKGTKVCRKKAHTHTHTLCIYTVCAARLIGWMGVNKEKVRRMERNSVTIE